MAEATAPAATDAKPVGNVRTSVVLPVYNEAQTLRGLVKSIQDVFAKSGAPYRPYEILCVNDGSTDGSAQVVDELASSVDQLTAIHLKRNWGQSEALAAGIEYAGGAYVVPMDADGQNDPADIPALLNALEAGYDCVSGRRVDRDDPLAKRIPSRIQTKLAKWTGPDINDFGCTLTAYRAEALADIELYGEAHRYIPAQLYDKGYDITELDVTHHPREHGSSHYGAGRLLRGFVDLLWHLIWVRYSTRPMHLLGGLGILLMGFGGALGGVSVLQRLFLGVPLAPKVPRLVLIAVLLVFGLQLMIFGVLAEFLTKLYYRDETAYRVDRVVG